MRYLFIFLFLALFYSPPSNSQNYDTSLCLSSDIRGAGEDGPVIYCDTSEQAHTGILNLINAQDRNSPKATPVYGDCGSFKCYTASIFNGVSMRSAQRLIVGGCPAGTEWFESLSKCDKPCSARNADLGGVNQPIKWADSSSDQCIAECKYSIVSDFQTKNVVVSYGGQTSPAGTRYGGRWEYTGDRCPIPQSKPKDDEKPKQECTPATYGQTYCITPDNKECYSASSGRTICWGPSEQGTKTDGPTIQEHKQGQQTPSAPPNTTYNSTTTVTTNISNNSSQTTTNNYTTNNNSPAGPSNNGEPANNNGEPTTPYNPYPGGNNGSGTGNSGNSTNGDKNASSGGGDCASPPVSSGDQILGQIAYQTWATRCNVEKGKLEGAGDCTDIGTVVGFSCSGDPVGCKQALEAKEANCKTWAADKNGNGQPDWTEGDSPTPDYDEKNADPNKYTVKSIHWGPDLLDTTPIFGGGVCPEFHMTFFTTTVSSSEISGWCNIVAVMRAVILIMAAYLSVRILMGGRE